MARRPTPCGQRIQPLFARSENVAFSNKPKNFYTQLVTRVRWCMGVTESKLQTNRTQTYLG